MAQETLFQDITQSARGLVSVTVTSSTTYSRCRGVYIGTSQSLDFTVDGTNWVTHQGCIAGTYLPLQVIGARKTTGPAAPTAGDVVFWY